MKNILLAVDFSESTHCVLDAAIEVAKAFSAHLYIIHVAAPNPDFVGYEIDTQVQRDAIAKHYRKEHQELGDFATKARQQGVAATALLVQGPTVEKLIQERVRLQADLIVVGSHGRNAALQFLVGSTSEGLIRKAHCSIMVIPNNVECR
jgi:nucleotide-binding universal stress UspA family protein